MQSKIELYGEVREAIRLGEYTTWTEMRFCKAMADVYGCIPLQSDGDNLNSFLSVLYHYGVVQGIRQERARKRKPITGAGSCATEKCNAKRTTDIYIAILTYQVKSGRCTP